MQRLKPVKIEGTYFVRGNERFIPVGAHWVPSTGLHWPNEWNPDAIEADFSKMQDMGFNIVRFDLFWAWFEPYPGVYNPEAFNQFDYFVEMANKYSIYLHPTFFIGGETGYYDVPWRNGRHPHGDPDMLRLQTDHVSKFAKKYATEPSIAAWDLTDEPPYWISRGKETTDAMGVNWTRLISGALRRYDKNHLICVGTDQEDLRHGPFRPDLIKDEVDFLSVHPYPIYLPALFPDQMVSERMTYCGAFQVCFSGGAGLPVMVHELGSSSAQYSNERIARYDMTSIFSSFAAGANGFILWDFTDAAPDSWKRVPYKLAPHETQFGLCTYDHINKPAGEEFLKFTKVVAEMSMSNLEPEKATVGMVVPFEWSKPYSDFSKFGLPLPGFLPYIPAQQMSVVNGIKPPDFEEENRYLMGAYLNSFIQARRSDLKVAFPREFEEWQQYHMLCLPSPLNSTSCDMIHVYTTFWSHISTYLEAGGNVYSTFSGDSAIPEMQSLFGASLSDHKVVEDVDITMCEDFYGLKEGDTFKYKADISNFRHWGAVFKVYGGRVIAKDQDGDPAIIIFEKGKGKALICAYPIECYLAAAPQIYERGDETYRLYQAFANWIGAQLLFSTNTPQVEIASLTDQTFSKGYAVLANHGNKDTLVKITSNVKVNSIKLLGSKNKSLDKDNILVTVKAYDGLIIEWSI